MFLIRPNFSKYLILFFLPALAFALGGCKKAVPKISGSKDQISNGKQGKFFIFTDLGNGTNGGTYQTRVLLTPTVFISGTMAVGNGSQQVRNYSLIVK